jgi:hypothetical protein
MKTFVFFAASLIAGCAGTDDKSDGTTAAPDFGDNETLDNDATDDGDIDEGDDGGAVGDFPMGTDDAAAQLVCELLDQDTEERVVLATSQAEAAQALVTMDESNPMTLVMPESGDGYFVIEVPDWMSLVRLFADDDASYEILGGDQGTVRQVAASCPDDGITDQRWIFHEWGQYTIRVDESSPAEVWFTLYKE